MISNWYGSTGVIDDEVRAIRTWNLILRDSTSLVLDRDGTPVPAQTVKLTFNQDTKWVGGDGSVGKSASRDIVIFGIKDHPTETATDLQTGDRFAVGKVLYEIRDVFDMPGGIGARAEQRSG